MQMMASAAPYFLLWCLSLVLRSAQSSPQIPCYFMFGDSLSDNGNNNDLETSAKVNYSPYGIDYPGKVATGRFSNGQNIIDVIADLLGFEQPAPSFASAVKMNDLDLLKGVNYASGSAGIRQETGQNLGVRIPLDEQLVNHQAMVSRISNSLGNETPSYLKSCLYMLNIGSNDYLNNYFMPDKYNTSKQYSPEQYAKALIKQYSQQIQTLYGMGARKVALFGVGEIGSIPQSSSKGLLRSTEMTAAALLFTNKLRHLVDELNSNLTDAKFTCINVDFIFPASSLGFFPLDKACCQVRSDGQCEEGGTTCENRHRYVFFDNFHPTEAMNKRTGGRAYKALVPLDVHPIDIRTLALWSKPGFKEDL